MPANIPRRTPTQMGREAAVRQTAEKYKSYFDCFPTVISAAPGRVNLIGEHVDHQGYDVFPCAIDRTIRTAVGPGIAGRLQIHFVNTNEFFDARLADLQVKPNNGSANYAVAAMIGVAEFLSSGKQIEAVGCKVARNGGILAELADFLNAQLPSGLRMLVEGEVPLAAGVSSSSALLVACALALLGHMGVGIEGTTLAAFLARAECHVGTASGGMDQACILLSERGKALRISFEPAVRAIPYKLPPSAAFVVANTGVMAPKAVDAAKCYNKRVFELKVACAHLWNKKCISKELPPLQKLTLRRVQEELSVSLAELEKIARELLGHRAFSKGQCIEILKTAGILDETLEYVGDAVIKQNVLFEPLRRVLHVLSEVERVNDFVSITENESLSDALKLRIMGQLMNSSQESLLLDFDASVKKLEDVTELARKHPGCYGARLTGAGWGGCAVALIHVDQISQFCDFLRTENFDNDDSIFSVQPSSGATVYKYEKGIVSECLIL